MTLHEHLDRLEKLCEGATPGGPIPCPTCGMMPKINDERLDYGWYTTVVCSNSDCPVCAAVSDKDEEEAIRRWNTRALSPTVVRALVAIVRCADNYVNPTDDDDVRSMLAFADLKKALAVLEGAVEGETIEKPRGTP